MMRVGRCVFLIEISNTSFPTFSWKAAQKLNNLSHVKNISKNVPQTELLQW